MCAQGAARDILAAVRDETRAADHGCRVCPAAGCQEPGRHRLGRLVGDRPRRGAGARPWWRAPRHRPGAASRRGGRPVARRPHRPQRARPPQPPRQPPPPLGRRRSRTMTADQLRTGLAAGTLEGRTVVATGRLRMQPWPCPSPMPDDCYGLQLPGRRRGRGPARRPHDRSTRRTRGSTATPPTGRWPSGRPAAGSPCWAGSPRVPRRPSPCTSCLASIDQWACRPRGRWRVAPRGAPLDGLVPRIRRATMLRGRPRPRRRRALGRTACRPRVMRPR